MFIFSTLLALVAATTLVANVIPSDDVPENNDTSTSTSTNTKKRSHGGIQKGTKLTNFKENKDWYRICKLWDDNEKSGKYQGRLSKRAFLLSDDTGDKFGQESDRNKQRSEESSFSQKLKKYRNNELKNNTNIRDKKELFPKTAKKLIQYLDLRAKRYQRDKCGVAWTTLHAKSLDFGNQTGEAQQSNFEASPGWIKNVLERNDRVGINLHGEANDMDDNERAKIMAKWKREEFHSVINKHGIPAERIYNADQTGLYYQKLPNRLYVEQARKKEYAGVKQMKDKSRVTLMVFTAADGTKGPLAMVGKPKSPHCFRTEEGRKPPMYYIHQSNAWFDKVITEWWIANVFWPYHKRKHGNLYCILILDNCTAHKIDVSHISDRIIIVFLPKNVTNKHQPADMGMIASLKVGYRVIMLGKLLDVFDQEGGYEKAADTRGKQPRGCRGLDYGGKPHLLDAMNILLQIWDGDNKYSHSDAILRCWRKADILPPSWNADINNDVGSCSMPLSKKQIAQEDSDEICDLFSNIKLRANEDEGDVSKFAALSGSFAVDGRSMSPQEQTIMIEEWLNVEDNQVVLDAEIDDELERLESGAGDNDDDDEDNDDYDTDKAKPTVDDRNDDEMIIDDCSVLTTQKPKAKMSLVQAEEKITELREYIEAVGAPTENSNMLLRIGRNIRAHNASVRRQQKSIVSFFENSNNNK